MKKTLTFVFALGLLACGAGLTSAALVNGNLDDPGSHEVDLATGWTLEEFRTVTGPSDTATFASFANHTPAGSDPDQVGVWYKNFVGSANNPATAHLYQDVPAAPGNKYIMTGWARFEQFFSGGLNQIPSIDPITGEFVLSPSPTKYVFALDFLGAGDAVLNSVEWDLHDDGGQINTGNWVQHMVMGIAPPGTQEVRVRSSVIDMVATFGGQSAFGDDFTLECIPEPASVALGLFGLSLLGLARRRG